MSTPTRAEAAAPTADDLWQWLLACQDCRKPHRYHVGSGGEPVAAEKARRAAASPPDIEEPA